MAKKAWIALVDWIDGDIEDTDEFRVFADNADDATASARHYWSVANGAEWPHCRIHRITVLPPARLPGLV